MKYLKAKRWEIMLFYMVSIIIAMYTYGDLFAKILLFPHAFLALRHCTMHCRENNSITVIILAAILNTLLLSIFCSWKIAVTFIAAFIWGWLIGVKNISLKSEVTSNVQ